jgi:outer membrane protein OmpA-like peptidoglycan-associated protein
MSRPRAVLHVPFVATAVALALATPARGAQAQGWRDRLKSAAKGAVDQATDAAGRAAGDAAAKKADKVVRCALGDQTCVDSAKAAGKQVVIAGDSSKAAGGAAAATVRPGEGAWANYDFKPGEKPLFTDDFSQDVVGNFPRRLEFVSGSSEVVEWQGKRWLSSGDRTELRVPLGQTLPRRYTIEFDMAGAHAVVLSADPKMTWASRTPDTDWFWFYDWSAGVKGDGRDATTTTGHNTQDAPVHVAIQVDGDYAKAYVNEKRVANVPDMRMPRSSKLYVRLEGQGEKTPVMLANLRVMSGGRALYDALAESGRVATQGIYFATGADRVRPESSPTLKEIGAMLADHPDLKLTIEGHTDNVGDAAANQALSQRRAEAVKQALVSAYHVDGARLTAKGMGATKPAAPNTTAEGRQTNRRVELVRQ